MPRKSPERVEVVAALQRVLRRGLPVTPLAVDWVLLGLRGVLARAVDPTDEASCTAALGGVLRGVLARLPDVRYAVAARALFGLPPGQAGQNLTARRKVAAAAVGHEVHHFRKRVEPRLVEQVAWALLVDAERFTRSVVVAPRLAVAGERQVVPADPFAWEVTEQEEALARVWSGIYALRAELLAVERLISLDVDRQQIIHRIVTGAWRWAQASITAIAYTSAFAIPNAERDPSAGEPDAGELVALAGWTPPLTTAEQARLRAAAAGDASRGVFVAALRDEVELVDTWITAFLTPARPQREQQEAS
ncbi:MAG: hypothetical protein M3Q39_07840 [Actinomycetota bacterium]|nr:hypothetical protein [Actinomycetota bacterium]